MTGTHTFIKWAKQAVYEYALDHIEPEDGAYFSPDDVLAVWYCKTLQNHKALLYVTILPGYYFEFTYNGDKDEAYLDVYRKQENIVVKREDYV